MQQLYSGDVYNFVVGLEGMTVRDLYAFGRHELSGTPYFIENALLKVVGLCVQAVNLDNRFEHDDDDIDSAIEADVMAYLTEDVDGDVDIYDGTVNAEVYDRMARRTSESIYKLYDALSYEIDDVLRGRLDVHGYLMLEEAIFRGHRSIAVRVSVS